MSLHNRSSWQLVTAKGKTKGEEKELNDDEVEEKIADILPEQLVSGLIDVNWKARLVAVEQLVEVGNKIPFWIVRFS